MIMRRLSSHSSKLTPKSKPSYSASLTVVVVRYFEDAEITDYSGNFHTTALQAPPTQLTRADPSKLMTYYFSSGSTVGVGSSKFCLARFLGAMEN